MEAEWERVGWVGQVWCVPVLLCIGVLLCGARCAVSVAVGGGMCVGFVITFIYVFLSVASVFVCKVCNVAKPHS